MSFTLVITIVGLLGMYLTGKKKAVGWILGIGSQALWTMYAFFVHDFGLLIPAVAYTLVYLYCYHQWTHEKVQ